MISVIIVSYNTKHLLAKCIESIRENMNVPYEIIVVDNNSQDGSQHYISKLDYVKCVLNNTNVGYSKAVNQGVSESLYNILVISNSDIEVSKGWAEFLLPLIDPSVGVVSPKLVNNNGRIVGVGNYGSKDLCNTRGFLEYDKGQFDKLENVDFISGAFFGITKTNYILTGGLSEEYFFYFEDTDLCMKCKSMGLKIIYVPVKVIHYLNSSPTPTNISEVFNKSRETFYKKWGDKL